MSPADIALEAAKALAAERGWTPIESVRLADLAPSFPRYLLIAKLARRFFAYGCDEIPGGKEARSAGRRIAELFALDRGEAVAP